MTHYNEHGFDPQGYDNQGYDRQGYDRQGYDKNGANRQGLDRWGKYSFPNMVKAWKTNVGTTTVGVILSYLLVAFTMPTTSPFAEKSIDWCFNIFATYFICSIMYASTVYPSYFDKPMQENSSIISFCNGFFGGIIFGLFWNGNLTKKRKGISYIISVILSLIELIAVALNVWVDEFGMNFNEFSYMIVAPIDFVLLIGFSLSGVFLFDKRIFRGVVVITAISSFTLLAALKNGWMSGWVLYWNIACSVIYLIVSIIGLSQKDA